MIDIRNWAALVSERAGAYHLISFWRELFNQIEKVVTYVTVVVVAEWLRRWTRNPLGSPRAGSNPADYEELFSRFLALISKCFGKDLLTRNKFDLNQLIPLNLQRKVKNLKHDIVFHLITYQII